MIAFHLRDDHGEWSEDSNVVVSRTGQAQQTLSCILPWPPSFEPESHDIGPPASSPDGQWVVADGGAVCRVDGSDGHWLTPGLQPDW